MREIKFRGLDRIDGKVKNIEQIDIKNELVLFENDGWVDGNNYELMQYTGLKDKNGKEIYEGDIIQLKNEDLEVIKVVCEFGTAKRQIFDNLVEITGFYFKRLCDDKKTFPIANNYLGKHDLELFEIIGNIYENPELLEAYNES
ncbi:putative phage protein (TIGR01671 family) [Sedimentibacter acidaminivorans]|uniref:Phage protein (TIGR01671 family) n=1 Tax=Sedimentibacter acidaminivorans TaxID=913099 RepID=A0ABS4GAA1_9FIRM|nr:YopX family protein [Sedimentibacter acidaminivorans]MBP1924613.1 putative phage protein (TIGR01671 family) [Sedimentibacter acidaminivorans]